MSLLPKSIVTTDEEGNPLNPKQWFTRVNPEGKAGRRNEWEWDGIICANVSALSDALCAASVIPDDSELRVLGRQVNGVDVLFAEIERDERGDPGRRELGEPRRLVLLEDKLISNPQAKREVLAQVLDYAQQAQQLWTARDLSFNPKLSAHAEWFKRHESRIDVMLSQGDLLLVIAGNDIAEDLLRLARRFAAGNDPLSLNELCLVSFAAYRRGNEHMLIPHVVSSVERHQRQVTIRVKVQDTAGRILPAQVEQDVEADLRTVRGALPVNHDARAFLRRAKEILDPKILVKGSPFKGTKAVRKSLEYSYLTDDEYTLVRFKIHFGGYVTDKWSPIEVGLHVESEGHQTVWHRRAQKALSSGKLPEGTEISKAGAQTVCALKKVAWSTAEDLAKLLPEVSNALLQFVSAFPPDDRAS
ncbi:MAG: hypothetical protein RBU30_01810 [Polyangia bacterium]|jgi:hypothetical protein|nr:hypothetical protein [Polyangia bacterium]